MEVRILIPDVHQIAFCKWFSTYFLTLVSFSTAWKRLRRMKDQSAMPATGPHRAKRQHVGQRIASSTE